jgi:beta-1,2-mannobiose phosphorylase / 1,2-beta-oligomannan phosphorylase
MQNLPAFGIPVERLHGGAPIIAPSVAPTAQWFDSGVTFNTAALYLERSADNNALIMKLMGADNLDDPRLRDGVVAAHYRARPKSDPGLRWSRSFTGLALFTPGAELLKRYGEPVICPAQEKDGSDYLGVEDPRVTRIGDTFYAVYCGVADFPDGGNWKAQLHLARSADLLNWEKLGPLRGTLNDYNNKDGVLFPDLIDGQHLLLHRPMVGPVSDFAISLATCDSLTGVWHDCGMVLHSQPDPACKDSWVGAGAAPIPLGDRRYLVIFHTGNWLLDGRKQYNLDAAIFNFQHFDPARPAGIVEARLNSLMVPETRTEIEAPYSDSVANAIFTCGAYEFGGDVYIYYGGGDTYVMAARVNKQLLLDTLEHDPRCRVA